VFAYGGVRAILAFNPGILPRMDEVTVDVPVLAFTAAIALLSGILFGLAPSLHSLVASVNEWLKQGSRSATSSRASRRPHNFLVIAEFSLALVVLVGAGLLIRTLYKMQAVSPGFNSDRILTALVNLPDPRYAKAADVIAFYDQLLERINGSPGVESSAVALSLPPNLLALTNPFHIEGRPEAPGQPAPAIPEIPISDGYFRALGVPLLRGRYFTPADRAAGAHFLIINENMARHYFPGEDPVGKRLQTGEYDPKAPWETIVGVVGNVKYEGLDTQDTPAMYVPFHDSGWCPWFVRSMFIVVRGSSSTDPAAAAIRSAVNALDKQLPVIRVRTMDELLYSSVAGSRFRAVLFGLFAALALILAATGIYGVVAYSVSQRTQEIGVRMALGAPRANVFGLIVKLALRLALVGVGIGLCASLALSQLMSSLLFGVSPHDLSALGGAAALLTLVALAAGYIPAYRAMRINPTIALRGE
jgi:putative ABC transport system permease protein